jgi:class 3 adenylate cyclase
LLYNYYQDRKVFLPRSNFRRLYAFAMAAGLGLGVISYGLFRAVERSSTTSTPFALIVALIAGVLIGLSLCVTVKLTLRQNAYDLYNHVLDVTNTTLPTEPYTGDEIIFMRQTFSQAFAAIPRSDDYPRLAGDLAISRDYHAALGVTVTHLAERMPVEGAALLLLDNERHQLFAAASWGKIPISTTFTIDAKETAIGRALQEQRVLLYSGAHSSGLLPLGGGSNPPALFCLPLLTKQQPLGVLCLAYRAEDMRVNEEQKLFARGVADLFTLSLNTLRYQQLFERESERLNAFEQLNSSLDTTEQLEQALAQVLKVAANVTDSEHGTLLLLEADENRVRHRIALEHGQTLPLSVVGPPVMRHGLAGWAIRERRGDIIDDTERDTRWLPVPGLIEIRSVMVVPLLYGSRVLAVLTLADPSPRHYSRRALSVVTGLTSFVVNILARMEFENLSSVPEILAARQLLNGHLATERMEQVLNDPAARQLLLHSHTQEAVVLFTAVRGLEQLTGHAPEQIVFEQVLSPYVAELSAIIFEHDGYVEQRSDGSVLAIFGYPEMSVEEPQRACQAALAVQSAIRRLRIRWRQHFGRDLHAGIALTRGAVTFGVTGVEFAQRYTVLGSPIQRAERLQQLARKDEVLTTLDVFEMRAPEGAFRLEPLEPFVKGEQETSQQVYRLSARL